MKPVWKSHLLRWITGEATRHDEQSLAGLAKDDPFLAEALEGYRSLPADGHAAALARLKAGIRQRAEPKRGAGFYLLRIAAVGTLLMVGILAVRPFLNKNSAEKATAYAPTAGTEAAVTADSTSAAEALTETTPEPQALEQTAAAPAPKPAAKSASPSLNPEQDAADQPAPPIAMIEEIALDDAPQAAPAKEAATAKPDADLLRNNKPAAPPSLPPAAKKTGVEREVTGYVTDETGKPLAGTTVSGGSTTTATDASGKYLLSLPAGAGSVTFSKPGFEDLEIALGPDNRLDVEMSGQAGLLTETTASKRMKAVAPKPKGGFKAFEKYIQDNRKMPAEAAKAGIKGSVTLRFLVSGDGTLSDFKVIEPLGFGCDEEAIRLLRQGPKWKSDAAAFATYSVAFE